jgi:glycosyltransferase involved in cell wall biosynthesis
MYRPEFSIITPTYNRGDVILRLWTSIKKQTCQDFEWIVIDDGSEDDTYELIKSIKDERIIIEKFDTNRGINCAYNVALNLARGKYILMIGSDDLFLDNALETFKKLWKDAPVNIGVIGTRCIEFETGKRIGYLVKDAILLTYEDIICSKKVRGDFDLCYRAEIIKQEKFPEDILAMESIVIFRIAKKTNFLFFDIPTKIVSTRRKDRLSHYESIIKNAHKMIKGYEILIQEYSKDWKNICPQVYYHYIRALAFRYILIGQNKKARKCLKNEIISNIFTPDFLKNLTLYFLSFLPLEILKILYIFYKRFKDK